MGNAEVIRKLQHPPCEGIRAVRIEFADGAIYEVSPGTRRISPSKREARRSGQSPQTRPPTSKAVCNPCSRSQETNMDASPLLT